MGCIASTDGSAQAKAGFSSPDDLSQNDKLEQQLLQERLQALYTFKILLLGAGESGKSTVVKQLRAIHNKKLTRDELATIADSLHQNVLDCIKALLYACHERFQIPLDDELDTQTATQIATWEEGRRISPEFAISILRLYNSQAIRTAYDRRSEFWLLDSCSYYMKHLERFASPGFMPNEEDCVMARIRTTGIVVSHLEQKLAPNEVRQGEPDTLRFEVVDVGGQRNERKKWIHCFDDVKAILFIESLAGYNQVLFEDCTKNRMIESLELFREITHRKGFEDTPIFLFLNKKDLFEQMVQQEDLGKTFPEYTGGKNLAPALEFIQNKFKEQLPPGKQVGFQVVTGVWKRDIKCSFEEVKKELIDRNRRQVENEKNKIRKDQRQYEKQTTSHEKKLGLISS